MSDPRRFSTMTGTVHAWTGYMRAEYAPVGYCGQCVPNYAELDTALPVTCKRCLAVIRNEQKEKADAK